MQKPARRKGVSIHVTPLLRAGFCMGLRFDNPKRGDILILQYEYKNMSVNEDLAKYAGLWSGTNKLYLSWMPVALKESESKLNVSLKANRQFVAFEYTWAYEGGPQEGLILLGCDTKSDAVQTVWTDSWHSSHTFMLSDGTVADDGSVSVKGYYKVKDHPDWGWRTDIVPNGDSLRIVMYNVSPDDDEEPAVETDFTRI